MLVLQSVQTQVRLRQAALCKQRNSLVPIGRLPPELLTNILTLAAKDHRTMTARAMELSAVSARWWKVLAATPAVWVDVRWGDAGCSSALQRSRTRPLDICVAKNNKTSRSIAEFVELITPHSARWRSLSWAAPGFDYLKPAFPSTHFPLLEELSIEISYPTLFILSDAPKLRTLVLKQVIFPFSMTQLPALTSLSIESIDIEMLPSVSDLVYLLRSMPLLQTLKLEDLLYIRDEPPPPQHFDLPVNLPNLEVLKLKGIVETVVIRLLQTIRAENLVHIAFGHSDADRFASDAIVDFLSDQDASDSLICHSLKHSGDATVYIRIESSSIGLRWWESIILLPRENVTHSVGEILATLPLHLVNLPADLVLTSGHASDRHDQDPNLDMGFLDGLPTLTEISDSYWSPEHIVSLLDYLSTPNDNGDYPCPNLEMLRFEASNTRFEDDTDFNMIFDALIRMLRRPGFVDLVDESGESFYHDCEIFMGRTLEPDDFYL